MKFEEAIENLATESARKRAANIPLRGVRGKIPTKALLNAKEEFINKRRIRKEYENHEDKYDFHRFLLYLFLQQDGYFLEEEEKHYDKLIDEVRKLKDKIKDIAKYIPLDNRKYDIYETVLTTILEDQKISEDEKNVLKKLQDRLEISILQHWLLRLKNNVFLELNELENWNDKQIDNHLRILERKGLLFYVEIENSRKYVIPEEIAETLRDIFGMELRDYNFEKLLRCKKLDNKDLRIFLEDKGLSSYGSKEELIRRIIASGFRPSEFLGSLTFDQLSDIAGSLPGVSKSGKKDRKIKNIINHFKEQVKSPSKQEDEREPYYKFYEDLASRNERFLMDKGIIGKSAKIGSKFEEATNYLFEKVLGFKIEMPKIKGRKWGVKADGKAIKNGDFIIWDCKTKEKDRKFSMDTNTRRQFTDYINEYKKMDEKGFIALLIITSNIKLPERLEMELLNIKRDTGKEISVVKANDLKKFAESVKQSKEEIDLWPFCRTKILEYEDLEKFLKYK